MTFAASPAPANRPDPFPPGSKYVAIGSSFASGPGLNLIDPTCSRSSNNYPHLLADALDLALTDVSCGGATVANLLSTSQFGRPPQIHAVTADTQLVTVTIGGNDAQYLLQLIRCSSQHNPAPVDAALAGLPSGLQDQLRSALCAPLTDADRTATQRALDGLTAGLVELVDQTRLQAPGARIVLVDYLTIVPESLRTCAALPVGRDEAKYFVDVANQLQRATTRAAQQSGSELVAASKASRRHDACSNDPWVFGFEFDDILAGGAKAFHPNANGMSAVADLVTKTLAQRPGHN